VSNEQCWLFLEKGDIRREIRGGFLHPLRAPILYPWVLPEVVLGSQGSFSDDYFSGNREVHRVE
jgi:hypothetical protein